MQLTVYAGEHDRTMCPVFAEAPRPPYPRFALKTPAGERLPAQYTERDGKGQIVFLLPWLGKGESLTLRVVRSGGRDTCTLRREQSRISMCIGGKERTGYTFGTDLAKPYFGPFFERYGGQITRLDPTTKEHPHHRCFWVSHGSVNGVDTWNEPSDCGFIRNHAIENEESGSVFAAFTACNTWTDHGGKPLCEEKTNYRLYCTAPGMTVADVELTLSAPYGQVTLGSTKEAGPVAVRMSDDITVKKGNGRFETGAGGVNEEDCWMKRAPWCDYYGTEAGHLCGFAILDHPENEGFPSYWHVRNYGLMAPNNFHIPGDRVIPAGESITWRYRLVAHNGDARAADISGKFADLAYAPKAEIK